MDEIRVGTREMGFVYDTETAKDVLIGYCFGTVPVRIGGRFGISPLEVETPIWAYTTYDCVPPSDSPGLSDLDILVVNGLNADIGSREVAIVQALNARFTEHLEAARSGEPFWRLPPDDLRQPETATPGSTGWHLQQAWAILVSAPGIGTAVAHKLLHHKLPNSFPLIDNQTLPALGDELWIQIHSNLAEAEDTFADLESWFETEAKQRDGRNAPLSRVRIHDILLWTAVMNQRDTAAEAGAKSRRAS